MNHQDVIAHSKEITSLVKINEEVMATYSNEDKMVKVWRINGEGVTCLNEVQLKHKAISIQYDNMTKTLAVMDTECNIGIFQKDYSGEGEQIVQEEKVEVAQIEKTMEKEKTVEKVESEDDEIDYENFDMDALEDDEEEEDKKSA